MPLIAWLSHHYISSTPVPLKRIYLNIILASTAMLVACETTNLSNAKRNKAVYLEAVGGTGIIDRASTGPRDTVSYWDEGTASGNPTIKISLKKQKARFYRGETLIGVSQISSGKEGFRTPVGSYKILQKKITHASNLYGMWKTADGTVINDDVDIRKNPTPPPGAYFEGAPMPYFMRITNTGVGMHQGYLPGYAASHGCIRMPYWIVRHFFHNASIGTPVIVEH
jgi:hypothetical protein